MIKLWVYIQVWVWIALMILGAILLGLLVQTIRFLVKRMAMLAKLREDERQGRIVCQ